MCFKRKKKEKKDLPRMCMYCEAAVALHDPTTVLCSKKGVVGREYFCRKFKYDPLKHIPAQTPHITPLSPEDIKVVEELLSPTSKMVRTSEIERVTAKTGSFRKVEQPAEQSAPPTSRDPEKTESDSGTAEASEKSENKEEKKQKNADSSSLSSKDNDTDKSSEKSGHPDPEESSAGSEKSEKPEEDPDIAPEDPTGAEGAPAHPDGIPDKVISDMVRESLAALEDDEDAVIPGISDLPGAPGSGETKDPPKQAPASPSGKNSGKRRSRR